MGGISLLNEYEDTAIKAIDEKSEELRSISLQIHENPELGGEEEFAHNLLVTYLKDQGFDVTPSAYGIKTAFVAEFSSKGGKGRVVSFNSEYDALPEIGHACGHNLIAISGVAGALALKAVFEKHEIPGKVKLFGTPAKETTGGKIELIKAGAYDDVDVSLMVHPNALDGGFFHHIALEPWNVENFGRNAHTAGISWAGINALDAIVLPHNSIGLLRHQILPTDRIHGIITNGGEAPNVIPDYTSGKFYIHGRTIENLLALRPRVFAEAIGCKANEAMNLKIAWGRTLFDVKTNIPLAERYEEHLKRFGIKFLTKDEQINVSRGSTDQGNVTYVVPGIHPIFDIKPPKGSGTHTSGFTEASKTEVAHEVTLTASKGIVLTGLDFLIDDEFAKRVKDSFDGGLHWKDKM
ncbi:putative amidohydrolase [Rhizophagus clarus]|uniref:Peptidase M20 domain-containing protein 2 n=1 Tax=Rhizophagus clarus TaxID=94130 RepID=A0A8H3QMF8_9GLOM|nr:putative amidohydrolase [Rhizophagus clarus]